MTVHSVKHKRRVIGCFSLILFIIFGSAFGVSVLKVIKAKKEKPEVYEEKIPVFNVFSTNITVIKSFNTVIQPDKSIELSAAVNEEIKNRDMSQLNLISEEEYKIGLEKIKKDYKESKINICDFALIKCRGIKKYAV